MINKIFTEYRISDIGQVIGGGTPSTSIDEYWNGNIPWISPKDLTNYNCVYISCGENFISEKGLNKSGTKLLPENTVLFSSRAPIGYVAIAANSICTNQGFKSIICDPDKVDYLYLYYYLKANLQSIKLFANGATFPELSGKAMKNIKINIFNDVKYQRKIADTLFKYDNLIENNNKRIKSLEQMAENLYKEWFIRFRFPEYENAEFENGIPKGWKKNKIESYYTTCSGGTPSRSKPQYYENGIYPWIKTGEIKDCIIIDAEEYITQEALDNSSAKIIPANSVIMAMYGVNIGSLAYVADKMTCNQACCVFSDKRIFSSKHYLYNYLKSIREYLLSISFGAAQQNLSQDLIKNITIVMPTDSIVKAFEAYVDSVYNNIKILLQKNRNLIKQRDLLIPRLMSGKLEVE